MNGYYTPGSKHAEEWPVVQALHLSFIKLAAKKYQTLNIRSQPRHSPAVLEVLHRELEESIPVPVFSSPDTSGSSIPEEIPPNVPLIEGASRTLTVNAYERNSAARRECIEHYGTRCKICGCELSELYGQAAADLIHVHHLIPLASIGKGYEVNPRKHLIPICPNCHAVIHRRNPPFTLNEMKQMLKAAMLAFK
ncbi:MAG: hypothetical protein HN348_08530 [Proteobacteria bacterium]|jgi:predicted HNH restriction endonuclease|nr:hypothetical protein [Pseudomonadota bacterium]